MNLRELEQLALDTDNELKDKNEWIKRYAGYANKILKNKKSILAVRKMFREVLPLYIYSSLGRAADVDVKEDEDDDIIGKNVTFDVRYKGQRVAIIKYKNDDLYICPEENTETWYDKKFDKEFLWSNKKDKSDKRGEEFRRFFQTYPPRKTEAGKKEHRCETALLTELSKTIGRNKQLKNIQPIRLVKSRFQLKTPFGASKGVPDYKKQYGGGIDIMCRTKHVNKPRLNVFELKDEYENPLEVMRQAVIYSVFVYRLLKTKEAENSKWWEIFGFKTPRELDNFNSVNAVVAMPNTGNNDESFAGSEIKLSDGGTIKLHYLWFKLERNEKTDKIKEDQIIDIKTSLFKKD